MGNARIPYIFYGYLGAARRAAGWLKPPTARHQSHRNLDGLRLIASVGIVLFHYNIYLSDSIPYTRPFTEQFPYFVDLFFVISGIVIAMVYADAIPDTRHYAHFLSLRLGRLYPLHLATLLFYAAIGVAAAAGVVRVINPERYDFGDFLPNLLLVHAWGFGQGFSFNYVSWSVSAEFFCYLVFPAILWLVRRSILWSVGAVVGIVGLAELASHAIIEISHPPPDYNVTFVRDAVAGFSVGVFTHIHRARWRNMLGPRGLRLAGNGVTAAMLVSFSLGGPTWLSLGLVYLAVFLHFVADEEGVSLVSSWRGFSGLSELTYSIYMLHTVVATVVVSFVFPRLFGRGEIAVAASLAVALVVTYGLSVLVFRGFEDPARRAWRRASDRLVLALAKTPRPAE